MFGFSDSTTGSFPDLPESLGYIELSLVSFNVLENKSDVIKELDFSSITREVNPKFFAPGSFLERAQDLQGIKTLARPSEIALKNNIWSE